MAALTDFPNEVLQRMAAQLSPEDIVRLCSTNPIFQQGVCQDDAFWRQTFEHNYSSSPVPDNDYRRAVQYAVADYERIVRPNIDRGDLLNFDDDIDADDEIVEGSHGTRLTAMFKQLVELGYDVLITNLIKAEENETIVDPERVNIMYNYIPSPSTYLPVERRRRVAKALEVFYRGALQSELPLLYLRRPRLTYLFLIGDPELSTAVISYNEVSNKTAEVREIMRDTYAVAEDMEQFMPLIPADAEERRRMVFKYMQLGLEVAVEAVIMQHRLYDIPATRETMSWYLWAVEGNLLNIARKLGARLPLGDPVAFHDLYHTLLDDPEEGVESNYMLGSANLVSLHYIFDETKVYESGILEFTDPDLFIDRINRERFTTKATMQEAAYLLPYILKALDSADKETRMRMLTRLVATKDTQNTDDKLFHYMLRHWNMVLLAQDVKKDKYTPITPETINNKSRAMWAQYEHYLRLTPKDYDGVIPTNVAYYGLQGMTESNTDKLRVLQTTLTQQLVVSSLQVGQVLKLYDPCYINIVAGQCSIDMLDDTSTHTYSDAGVGLSLVVGPDVIVTMTAVQETKMHMLFTPPVYKLDYLLK